MNEYQKSLIQEDERDRIARSLINVGPPCKDCGAARDHDNQCYTLFLAIKALTTRCDSMGDSGMKKNRDDAEEIKVQCAGFHGHSGAHGNGRWEWR